MSKFTIAADATLDLADDVLEKYQIHVIPSYVALGDNMMEDYPGVTQDELFAYVKSSGKLPQTAAANPDDYTRWFTKLKEPGKPLILIAKSSGISSCYENAVLAAQEMEDVYVMDSLALSGATGLVAVRAAKSGIEDPKELVEDLNEYASRIECSFVIETLEFLYKGGRCSGMAALGANILKLRPEIVMDNGHMRVGKKYRGLYETVLMNFIDEKLAHPEDFEPDILYCNHTIRDRALLERLLKHIEDLGYFKEVREFPACSAIATHCGPNCFGMHPVRKKTV